MNFFFNNQDTYQYSNQPFLPSDNDQLYSHKVQPKTLNSLTSVEENLRFSHQNPTSFQTDTTTNSFFGAQYSQEHHLGHNRFVDTTSSSNFWNQKANKEHQNETWNEISVPRALSHIEAFDSPNTQPQINRENSQDLLDDKFNDDEDYDWEPALDEILLELAFEFKCDWSRVARRFPYPKPSAKALKDRYRELNSISLPNKARFSHEEDRKILKYFQIYGTNWRLISSLIPGRPPTTIKNRFYSSLRTRIQRYSSDNTPLTSSRATQPLFYNIPSLRRGSLEDIGFNCHQEQSLEIGNMIPKLQQQQQQPAKEQYFECDKFFAFDNAQEPKTTEISEEPNDLEYQNNTVYTYSNQNQNHQQFYNFPQHPQQIPSNNVQSNQLGVIDLETYDWSNLKSTNQIKNNHHQNFNKFINSSQSGQEVILVEDDDTEEQKTNDKDTKNMVKELNNRVSVVMSLCYQIQQEIERTQRKPSN